MTRKELIEYLDMELEEYARPLLNVSALLQPVFVPLTKKKPTQIAKIHEMLKPIPDNEERLQVIAKYRAITLVGNLTFFSINEPTDEQMDNCIRICAGSTDKKVVAEMVQRLNDIANGLPDEFTNSIRNERLLPVSIVLYYAILEAYAETEKQQRLTVRAHRKTKFDILSELVSYMQEHSILSIISQDNLSTKAYDDFLKERILLVCKLLILHTYDTAVMDWCERQENLITQDAMRQNHAIIKEAAKKNKAKQSKSQAPLVLLNPKEKSSAQEVPDIQSILSGMALPRVNDFSSLREFDEGQLSRMLRDMGVYDSEVSGRIKAVCRNADEKLDALQFAADEFRNAIVTMKEACFKERDWLVGDVYPIEVSESALQALLQKDEVCHLFAGQFAFNDLRSDSTLPVSFQDVFELNDAFNGTNADTAWDDFSPGENGKLAIQLVDDYDIMHTDAADGEGIFPVKIASVLANYGGRQFDTPFEIRKSLIKAFREKGFSERKARDYAVIIATMQMVNRQNEGMLNRNDLIRLHDTDSLQPTTDATVIKARDEAVRLRILAEKESKACRHEMAVLQKQIDELKQEIGKNKQAIAKRDQLITLYEQMGEERAAETPSITFPYRTDKRIILYGGFDSFRADIQKLLPDIRMIPPTAHPDFSPIRNADCVFLQINKTGHSNYWHAMDIAKASGVEVFHLNNASPKVCAEFIVNTIKDRRS